MTGLFFPVLADAGVWYAFANSDGMGKGIVLLLFLGSMFVWFIMIEKWLVLYRAKTLSERFAANFGERRGMNSMLREAAGNPCPVAQVYLSGMQQLLEFYGTSLEEATRAVSAAGGPRKLSAAQLEAVQTTMEREISSQIFVIEERIGVLATAVSLSPFLGLFGTVWGVMLAFCGVAQAGSANIQALAPGVAGALLTTVAGLIVAIPSLVGYNTLTQMIRKITVSMDNFSESFMARLKLEQIGAREETAPVNPAPASRPAAAAAAMPPAQPVQYAPRPAAMPQYPANPAPSQYASAAPVPATPTVQYAPPRPAAPAVQQYAPTRPTTVPQYPANPAPQTAVPQYPASQGMAQSAPVAANPVQPNFAGMEAPGVEPEVR